VVQKQAHYILDVLIFIGNWVYKRTSYSNSRDSSVGIVTRGQSSIPGRGRRLFFSPQHPDWPSLLDNG
jgi:hypothetical protein